VSLVNIYVAWLFVMKGRQRNATNAQIWKTKTTWIMMATVRHVTSSSGLRKFQAAWFLLNRGYKTLCFSEDTVTVYQSTWCNIPEDTNLCYYRLHISKNSWSYRALIFYIMWKSFISVWSVKFSSRRVAASPLPGESRVADETQQLICSYDFTYRVYQSNSPNRLFTD
jgi:hypothetical protein